jgi:hypothetical protein
MWVTHSATLAKPSHLDQHKRASLSEDYTGHWRVGNTRLLAVADGVGRADRAADASRLAIATAVRHSLIADLSDLDDSPLMARRCFERLGQAIQKGFLSDIKSVATPDAWQTTLALVAISGRDRLAILSFGDSFILTSSDQTDPSPVADRPLEIVLCPTRLSANDPTRPPITLHSSFEHAEIKVVAMSRIESVFLSTDGLEMLISPSDETGSERIDTSLRRMIEFVRDENAYRVDALLAGEEGGLPLHKPDDYGVAIAAWR